MILNLLVFAISATAWVAALWLVLLPRMDGWPDLAVAAVHIAPPVSVMLLWTFVRRRIQRKRANDAQVRDERVQAELTAARDAARKTYNDEMRQRRFGCDCRMVTFSRIGLATPTPLPDPGQPNVDIRPIELDEGANRDSGPLLDCLAPAIGDALYSVYSACRASIAFPIFVLPPGELSGEEVLTHLRTVQSAIAEEFAAELNTRIAQPSILFLPAGDSVPGSVLSLFESAPDMPGAIILAFDSPYLRALASEDAFEDEPDAASTARRQLSGRPSEAVVALLMTNAELPSMLSAISPAPGAGMTDSMTPFWEKAIHAGGALESLSRMPHEIRTELRDTQVLGRMHRAAIRQPMAKRTGVLELTRTFQDALEQAQINAGLIAPPFVFDDSPSETDEAGACHPVEKCAAIVHNAGSVEVAGRRLAALGSALYYFEIDLSLVDNDAVLNVVNRIGDTGRASGIGQLALAIVYAAQNAAPALCAEFMPDDSIAASFVMPAGSALRNGQH